ncbi:hypothetical protein VHEMI09866 [[Torrubiella] hemipterigena]|uniref:Uncharacterized protein n=1 Tax=[Torrubiella] hemipterigena TaxID=1531966 RepID=A0A0A1TSA2_9HYPO|nr:hypothetical protein VHEMI09866 [[Torrubiella] hemipterigena]
MGPEETMALCCPVNHKPNGFICSYDIGPLSTFPASYSSACIDTQVDKGRTLVTETIVGPETTTVIQRSGYTARPSLYQVPINETVYDDPGSEFYLGPADNFVQSNKGMLILIQSKGDSGKDGKGSGEAPVSSSPKAWMSIGMPLLVAGLGAIAGSYV